MKKLKQYINHFFKKYDYMYINNNQFIIMLKILKNLKNLLFISIC